MSKETKVMLGIGVLVIAGLIGLFVIANRTPAAPLSSADAAKLVHDDSHKQGSGAVTVVEFGDYQCPVCGAAYPITKQILNDYGSRITFVFRNFPLQQHQNAQIAAEAAEAAAAQGKFWEMHDKLYETQNTWGESSSPLDLFVGYATDVGLNVDQFKSDVQGSKYASVIAADQADGNSLGVQGTPTFYVNGVVTSDYSYNTLKTAIDADLK